MNIIRLNIIAFIVTVSLSYSQGLTIGSNTTFSLGSSTLRLTGNWNNAGTFTANNGTVIFNGAGAQTIANASAETFNHLTVNKTSGDVQLSNNISVTGNLTVTSGDLDMNGKTISLGASAMVSETAGNTVKGNGSIFGTIVLNAPSSVNPFDLGATITSAEDLGGTIITRGHSVQTGGGETSMLRYYDIAPTNNSGLNATLVFAYDESELNSIVENELTLFKSTDAGISWMPASGSVNITSNTVTVNGLNDFSRWTLGGSSNPLPVELVSFTASAQRLNAELKWSTASEVNNYGFEVERSAERSRSASALGVSTSLNVQWTKVGFVEGNGTTNAPKEYSFTDKNLSAGRYAYRLKQIDRDGKFTYSQAVEVTVGNIPKVFALEQNYPNPFNPSTIIGFTLQTSGMTTLKIYDAIGREVAVLANENLETGVYYQKTFNAGNLSSGLYFAWLQSGDKMQVRKLILMK